MKSMHAKANYMKTDPASHSEVIGLLAGSLPLSSRRNGFQAEQQTCFLSSLGLFECEVRRYRNSIRFEGSNECESVPRNQLKGTVKKVEHGAVNSEVTIELPGGIEIVSIITRAVCRAVEDNRRQRGLCCYQG